MMLQVEFTKAGRGRHGRSGSNLALRRGDPWLFWWTIAIFLLIALTTFSWFISLYIFRHPEKPRNYRLLARFHKLEPLVKFNERSVPQGKFHTSKEIYARFFNFSEHELTAQNELFKRHYIRNYADEQPVYIKGDFRIYKVSELTPERPFMSGLVVRAKSVDLPNVSIEYIFPTESLPRRKPQYGDPLVLTSNDSFASVLHVSRLPEESLCFSVVPLTYHSYRPAGGKEAIALSPPERLNLEASWPLTNDTPMAEAEAPVEMAGPVSE